MSTSPQDTLTSQDVYKFTISTLDALLLEMPGARQRQEGLQGEVYQERLAAVDG